MEKPENDPETVAEAIRETGGCIKDASDIVGCHRDTIWRYYRSFESCRDARDQARNELIDLARKTLREAITEAVEAANWSDAIRAVQTAIQRFDNDTEPKSINTN